MDLEANSRHGVLERMLMDENVEPTDLPLSLLEDITDRFSPDHKIGRGGFAVVYKGIVGKRMVAVKKLFKTISIVHENNFHKEVECMMNAKHKNIVRFLGYCAEAHGKAADNEGKFVMAHRLYWLLCFEYVPNGNLQKYITDASGGLEWRLCFRIIKGICEGLHYLHMNRILHLDLKPANILLDSHMVPKIADFGLSRYLNEEKTHDTTQHLFGTPGYMAPEFYGGRITFASDIYSLGVIIMEILTGVKGYPEYDNVIGSWMNRLEGDTQLEQVRVCTKIGMECMESDPKKRPVARCIINLLDKTGTADDTRRSSSLEPLASSLEEQPDQEGNAKLDESLREADIMEHPDAEDVAESLGNDYSHEGQENAKDWSSWEGQDTDISQGTSIFSSNSSVLDKLNIFKIFKRDARRKSVRNGGRELESVRGLRIFTKGEIKKITRNNSQCLGKEYCSKVYKGSLPDDTMVAVKTYIEINGDRVKEFVKAVEIQTQLIHPNILKLIGCCMEADLGILVHEFAAKGNLGDILHGNEDQMLLLDLRLDIAIGTAEGLRYMHSGGIRHGDVRPHTILLDEMLTRKISDFDLSKLLNRDGSFAEHVVGHRDYIDPVFMGTGLLSKKSDVYSFGVVLLELIIRKKYVYYEIPRSGGAIFDKDIAAAEDVSVLEEIGELAVECLKVDIEERPDMTEVTERLVMIRRGRRLQKARNAS